MKQPLAPEGARRIARELRRQALHSSGYSVLKFEKSEVLDRPRDVVSPIASVARR